MARGVAEHLLGNWSAGQRCCDRAAAYLQDRRCRDVNWEVEHGADLQHMVPDVPGKHGGTRAAATQLIGLAQDNDDLFAVLNFGTVIMTAVLLAGDDPAERGGWKRTGPA